MLQISNAIQTLLPFLYGILLIGFAGIFFRSDSKRNWIFPAIIVTLVLHTAYIGLYTVLSGHCLLTTSHELFSLIAFTLLVIYIIVEPRPGEISAGTGAMVALVTFLFQLTSSLSSHTTASQNPIYTDPLFNIHVTSAVFGYAALTLATIYGSLYLLLYLTMKNNTYGPVFQGLPSLGRLEKFGLRASAAGFIFLSISIIFGALLISERASLSGSGNYLYDPKTIATILTWLVFGSTLFIRRIAKIEGRKLVLFWMSGFALTLISMTIINAVGTQYHNFL